MSTSSHLFAFLCPYRINQDPSKVELDAITRGEDIGE